MFVHRLLKPVAGRILVRALRDATIVVGVLHFRSDLEIVEGAAYAMRMEGDEVALEAARLDDGVADEFDGTGLGQLATCPVWYRHSAPETMTVRMVKAFPDSNSWSVVAVAPHPVAFGQTDDAGHAWFDVHNGHCDQITPVIDAVGTALSQLLTQYPIWPDVAGVLHSVPQIPTAWRESQHRATMLLVQVGRGEINSSDYLDIVRRDPRLSRHAARVPDPEFCRFLAVMERNHGLDPVCATPADAHARREALAERCLTDMLPAM